MTGLLTALAATAPVNYDTQLSDAQRIAYNAWRSRLPVQLRETDDYDLQGAFLGGAAQSANHHLTDQYKKPNHATFSTESQYSTPQNPGGEWTNDGGDQDVFWASQANMRNLGGLGLAQYFREAEPDATVVLPINYRLPRK